MRFRPRKTGADETDRNFEELAVELRDAERARERIEGRVLDVTLVSATNKDVYHQLGRVPDGWSVVDKTANADVWRPSTEPMTDRKIVLRSSANVTIKVRVF